MRAPSWRGRWRRSRAHHPDSSPLPCGDCCFARRADGRSPSLFSRRRPCRWAPHRRRARAAALHRAGRVRAGRAPRGNRPRPRTSDRPMRNARSRRGRACAAPPSRIRRRGATRSRVRWSCATGARPRAPRLRSVPPTPAASAARDRSSMRSLRASNCSRRPSPLMITGNLSSIVSRVRKPLAASLALAAPPDRRAVFADARVDDAGVYVLAEGAVHASVELSRRPGTCGHCALTLADAGDHVPRRPGRRARRRSSWPAPRNRLPGSRAW